MSSDWKNVQYKDGKFQTSTGGGGGASALNDLSDVKISSVSDGQVLKYDNATSKWVNANGSGGNISDLDDVSIASILANQILRYNSTSNKWENQNLKNGTEEIYKASELNNGSRMAIEHIVDQEGGSFSRVIATFNQQTDLTGILFSRSWVGVIVWRYGSNSFEHYETWYGSSSRPTFSFDNNAKTVTVSGSGYTQIYFIGLAFGTVLNPVH